MSNPLSPVAKLEALSRDVDRKFDAYKAQQEVVNDLLRRLSFTEDAAANSDRQSECDRLTAEAEALRHELEKARPVLDEAHSQLSAAQTLCNRCKEFLKQHGPA